MSFASQIDPQGSTKGQVVFGVDIGGTNTSLEAFIVRDGKITGKVQGFEAIKEGTVKGRREGETIDTVLSQVPDMIEAAKAQVEALGYDVAAVGVGSPGKFDHEGKIKPNSNPNIGRQKPEGGTEMDDVNLQREYELRLVEKGINLPIIVKNDGVMAQMGMITESLNNPATAAQVLDKTVGYIGPGTGLGGSFAVVGKDGSVEAITDGHITDMMVQFPDHLIEKLKAANERILANNPNAAENEKIYIKGTRVKAEDVLSGENGMEKFTGLKAKDIENDPALADVKAETIDLLGEMMARVIISIKQGDMVKQNPDQQWPQTDIDAVKATSAFYYYDGGATRGEFAGAVIEKAKAVLEQEAALMQDTYPDIAAGLRDVAVIRNSGASPEMAAASAATNIMPEREHSVV